MNKEPCPLFQDGLFYWGKLVNMKTRIDKIDTNQVLKYLAYRGSSLEDEFITNLNEGMDKIKELAVVHWLMKEFPLVDHKIGGQISIPGQDSLSLLRSCHRILLLALSLGPQVDQWIYRKGIQDLSKSIIYDAIASAAVEGACEQIEYEIKIAKEEEGLYLTDRFSPGYGDVDISFSKIICQLLDTSNRMGLSVSQEGILVPRKSITAFIGISKEKQVYRQRTCQNCAMEKDCIFRKRGLVCYGIK